MAVEIERKFLLRSDQWRDGAEGEYYCQAYLNLDKARTIRIRITDSKAFLTIKGPPTGISRAEFEYEIPQSDAREMLPLCQGSMIEKRRFKILAGKHVWEIDEFLGDNSGLVVAEIELGSEDEAFDKPSWLGKEVSSDPRYSNSRLVGNPFCNWSQT